jgi:hypothetical protein
MDQAKTCIPYDSVEFMSDADVASMRIPQMVMGGIIHGQGKYVYVTDGLLMDMKGSEFGKLHSCLISSNIVLFTVVNVLQDLICKISPNVDTLYVQIDGCGDNVNNAAMVFLQLLIEAGRFKEIELNRLPVGHTHEDTL